MESLDGAFLGVVGSLLRKIEALQSTEDGARQLRDDLNKTKVNLEKLSEVYDPPQTVSCWMKHARELFYDMEDFLDNQSVQTSGADRVNQLIFGFKTRIDKLEEICIRYNFEYVLGQTTNTRHRLPIDHGRKLRPIVPNGIYDPPDELLRWLNPKEDDRVKQLMVLSIHGVEGIGKSTLAQKVWRDLEGYFECRAFIMMAKKPDMRMILTSILSQVRPERPPENFTVPDLIQEISEHLLYKRYFIVIDGLWTVSIWDVLRHAFPDCNSFSRILITTATENIALACCRYDPKYTFRMKPLSEEHSKRLFIGTAFGPDNGCPPQLNDSLDEITRKCGGLPLALTCLSTFVARLQETTMEKQVAYFKFMCSNLRTNSTDVDILNQVLKLCYNSLPNSLKTCLLYLGVYTMNYPIQKEDLVKQWIAEGFVWELNGKDIEEVARSFFDELVNLNLIQQMDISNCDKKRVSYRVHPVLYSCLTCTSTNENFITIIDYTQNTVVLTDKIRRLALHFGSATYATPPANTGLSQVRSFSYMGLMSCMPSLGKFKLVRVIILHFQYDHGEVSDEKDDHSFSLTEISKLFLLRYLQVRCSITVVLPDKVQYLEHLETLEVNAEVADVPSDIVSHQSLKHVRLGRKMKHNHLIRGPDTSGREAVFSNASSRESSESLQKLELLPPICSFSRLPQWVGQLKELRVLEIVVRELGMYEPEFLILSGLPFLTALSLHVRRPNARRVFNFPGAALPVLKYLKLVCGVLLLSFQKEAVCNLEKLKIGFNIHSEVDYGTMLSGIDNLLNLQVVVASIGAAEESGLIAAESALRDTVSKHQRFLSFKVKRVEPFDEEHHPSQICSPTDQKNQSEIREEDSSPTEDITRTPVSVPLGMVAGPIITSKAVAYQEPQIKIRMRSGSTGGTEIELGVLYGMMDSLLALLKGLLELDHALPSNVRRKISLVYDKLQPMCQDIRDCPAFCSRSYMNSPFKYWSNDCRELALDIEDIIDLCTLSFTGASGHALEPVSSTKFCGLSRNSQNFVLDAGSQARRLAPSFHITADAAVAISSKNERLTRIRRKIKALFIQDEILHNLRNITWRIAEQHEWLRWGVRELSASDPLIRRYHHQRGTFLSYTNHEELFGMARPIVEVCEMVMEAGEHKVISIVGMAGSGKTTLAAGVCRELYDHFSYHAIFSCGQNLDMVSEILKEMLLELGNKHWGHDSHEYDGSNISHMYDGSNINQLIERIRKLLMNKRYLIVVDDLRSKELWETIKWCFQENNHDSRIIITTRNTELAMNCCSSDCIHKIGPLNLIDSKSLFLKRVFGNERGCPNHLEAVSAQIIERCGGLPLALVSFASLLKDSPPTQEEWERHILNFLSSSQGKYMMEILGISYNDLGPNLNTCMQHLSIFPKHYEVEIDRLVRLWIAEGFIGIRSGKYRWQAEETAQRFLEELISRDIIEPLHPKHNGIPTYCRVHPVMHDFIVHKSIEENFVTLIDAQRQDAPTNNFSVLRLSVQGSRTRDQEGAQIVFADLSHARSITVFGRAYDVPPLTNMRLVRVLDLDGCRGQLCLDGLHNLLLLRYLSLRDTDVSELPVKIGRLRFLETLDLRSTNVKELPASIVRLEKLIHLLTGKANLPHRIRKMKALQKLSGAIVTNAWSRMVKELGKLAYLRELDLSCDLTEVPRAEKHFMVPVDGFQSLRRLCIQGTLPSVTFDPSVLPRLETLELKFEECFSVGIFGVENLVSLKHVLFEFSQHDAIDMEIVDTVREAASRARRHPEVTVIVDGWTLNPIHSKEKEFKPLH